MVSIPDRVLGIFRPPVPQALVYLVFNVHLRLCQQKYHFSLRPVNTPCLTLPLKPLSDKGFSICVCRFHRESASNPYSNCITAPKFNPSIFTPSNRRNFTKNIVRSPTTTHQYLQYYPSSHPPLRPATFDSVKDIAPRRWMGQIQTADRSPAIPSVDRPLAKPSKRIASEHPQVLVTV